MKWFKNAMFRTEVMFQLVLMNALIVVTNIQINRKHPCRHVQTEQSQLILLIVGTFFLVQEMHQKTHIQKSRS